VDDAIVRRDVREEREGAELDLELKVQSVADCEPIKDVTVEIWHADEVHTGQLYFDDEVTDQVYEAELYASRGERDVRKAPMGSTRPAARPAS
jgi:hypothetical protein